MGYYLGLDVGSVSTNFVLLDKKGKVVWDPYTFELKEGLLLP